MKAAHQRAPARIWVLTVSTLLLAFRAVAEQEAPRGDAAYIVLPETESPDGRFALAWSVPKHPDLWTKARDATTEQADSLMSDIGAIEDDIVNQVVELQTGKVLAQLTTRYWEVGELRPNRHHLDVVWSATSNLVLVNHTFRWDCRAFEAVRIGEEKIGARLDLKKALDAKLRQHFKKALPRGSGITVLDLAISFSEPALVSGETFMTTVEAVFPTKGDGWSGQAEVRFALRPSKEPGLTMKVLGLK